MKNLSCVVFVNKIVREFSFSSLQFDGEYYYLPQEYFGTKANLILPITKTNGAWWIGSINCSDDVNAGVATMNTVSSLENPATGGSVFETLSGQKLRIAVNIYACTKKEKEIEHNDYISVENFEDHIMFSVLFLENSKIDLNGTVYNLPNSNISIGRSEDCDIIIKSNESVSRTHAVIGRDNSGNLRVESAKGKPNFYLNGSLQKSCALEFGDVIQILDVKILVLQNQICVFGNIAPKLNQDDAVRLIPVKREKAAKSWFIRTPRIITGYNNKPVEIDPAPVSQKSKPMPAILTIGPSLTMSMVMLVTMGVTAAGAVSGDSNPTSLITSGALAVSMLLGAILWPVLTRKYQSKKSNEGENLRINLYNEYITGLRNKLTADNAANQKLLNEVFFPSPETIGKIITDENLSRRLYEKTKEDDDYLTVRLGSGRIDSDIAVITQKNSFSIDQDLLSKLPEELKEEFKSFDNMPIRLSLAVNKSVGVIGNRSIIDNLIKSVYMSLTFGHSYDEVKTVFVYRNQEQAQFDSFKKAPHIRTDNYENRYVATTKEEVHRLFGGLSEQFSQLRELGANKPQNEKPAGKFFVFFIFDRDLVEGEPLLKKLENPAEDDPFSTFFVYNSILKLPKECKVIIQADSEVCGYYSKTDGANKFEQFKMDGITADIFDAYTSYLQNVRIKIEQLDSGVPERVSFLGMYRAGNVEALNIKKRWEESCSYKSLGAPIGIKSGGEVFSLNIHESFHGPHGLAAGMTGSGKSELLQAFILSLAINFHPDDISVIIIDYKGGGMANAFVGMPHLAGKITNLSGSTLRRSLISIDAELKRRQSVFAAAGVNNIDKYQKLYKEGKLSLPMPHLVIVADEFAQLKTQQPEFMKKIVDIAQIGRSLGVHLLLATQKPAGVVDDQIWGNSRFRMCLKVLEKQDSQEMIKKPDAAYIKLPGRCYVQVGYDEVYEYLQSGYTGAPYIPSADYADEEDRLVSMVDSAGNPIRSARLKSGTASNCNQLEAIVRYLENLAKEEKITPNLLWLNPIASKICLQDIDDNAAENFNGKAWQNKGVNLSVCAGFGDYPETQEQLPLYVDFKKGNYAVYGGPSSGKTTFLQTVLLNLALKNSPDKINFYIFDFGSRVLSCFAKMPHTKAVLFADDSESIGKNSALLLSAITERQKLFGQAGVTSFESYNANAKTQIPAIVAVVDNYSIVTERYGSVMGDGMVKIAREGAAYGVYLLLTGSNKSAIYYRVADYITNNLALKLLDQTAYREVLKSSVSFEPEDTPGRGIVIADKKAVEFQVALPHSSDNELERTNYIKELAVSMSKAAEKAGGKIAGSTDDTQKKAALPKSSFLLDAKAKYCLPLCKTGGKNLLGLDLESFKTVIITGMAGDSTPQNQKLIANLTASCPSLKIMVFDVLSKLQVKQENVTVYDKKLLSKGIAALKAVKSKTVIFINDLPDFYDEISDEDAMALADFTASNAGKICNYIAVLPPSSINTMTFTPFFNNITKERTLNRFIFGREAAGVRESVFEEVLKARKVIEQSDREYFVADSVSCEPTDIDKVS